VLINRGTLHVGDILVVGTQSGRVRAGQGPPGEVAPPSLPVEVLGIGGVPMAGDTHRGGNEARAREVAAYRQEKATAKRTAVAPSSLENMFSALAAKQTVIEYPVVIKADVQVRPKRSSTRSTASRPTRSRCACCIRAWAPSPKATWAWPRLRRPRSLQCPSQCQGARADRAQQGADEVLRRDLSAHRRHRQGNGGRAGSERIETVVGRAEVKEVFPAGKKDKAAGLLVLEGYIRKGIYARLTRNDVIVSKTTIASLRRFKDDVSEVRAGLECGVVLQDTNDIKAGDTLEVFEVEERERTL
jgi:translation initiation factor IF-2